MNTILPGYVQTPYGGWVEDNGSGPYFFDGGSGATYKPLPSGFWVKSDGSGPYFYDTETKSATALTILFRSIT